MNIPIVPRSVEGRFRSYKTRILILAYTVYFGLPWMPWPRDTGPDQAILFDIGDRKFYLFDLVVQPEQIFWLAGFLMIAALLLFFVTGVAGRVFCGYFCFQTLWSDLFYKIEHRIQGERPARIRLNKQAWNAEKLRKKGITWILWFAAALWTAISFTLYWGVAGDLLLRFFTGDAPAAMLTTVFILTSTTFLMAGVAREQVCLQMCPYARFQSVMFDDNTRVVSYDRARGEGSEGRSKPAKGLKNQSDRASAGVGDCVDCGLCVQVCPTGIDIRDGLQVECIHCALCIDACDNIMGRMGWDAGLIRYSSDTEYAGGRLKFFTLKNVGYGLSLMFATGLLFYSVASKPALETAIRQTREPLFVKLSDTRIQNSYEIKLSNQTSQKQTWRLSLQGLKDAEIDMGRLSDIRVDPLKFIVVYVKVKVPTEVREHSEVKDFNFVVTPIESDIELSPFDISARFYFP